MKAADVTPPNAISRREFVAATAAGLAVAGLPACGKRTGQVERPNTVQADPSYPGVRPNIVLINADDLGYGDLSCYGSRSIKTPNIDAIAGQGVRFTNYYACDSVCTPSRAGLLTGRYPVRMGLDVPVHPSHTSLWKSLLVKLAYLSSSIGLMDVSSGATAHGLPDHEITLAEALKVGGYRTALVGKWHLGDFAGNPTFHPLAHGFDRFFGVPHSNDMTPFPLYRDYDVLEDHIRDQASLTRRYTDAALELLAEESEQPFFLYLAHTFPHRPLFASPAFEGRSDAGLYGDAVEEIDWSVGRIVEALERSGQWSNTVMLFTSDNGPWYQGSPGGLRGRKGQSYEGGSRVPLVVHWPGLPGDRQGRACDAVASNLDLFPTLLQAAGLRLPSDRIIDGRDIAALLTSPDAASPHKAIYYYHHGKLEGVRAGRWKYVREIHHYVWPMPLNQQLGGLSPHTSGPLPLLFNMDLDPGEAYNLAEHQPAVVREMEDLLNDWSRKIEQNPQGWIDSAGTG